MVMRSSDPSAERVVALIVHYRDVAQTARAASVTAHLTRLPDRVVVINNDPSDAMGSELARALPEGVKLITTGENLGYAGGNNIGLRLAIRQQATEYAWIVNPDGHPEPEALTELVAAADRDQGALIVGSCILRGGPWRPGEIAFAGAKLHPRTGEFLPLESSCGNPVVESDAVFGSSMLVRLSGLDTVGLIPEEYFLYFEEVDFALRARAAGWRVVVNRQSRFSHIGPRRRGLPTPAYVYYMTRNRLLFSRRWGFPQGDGFGLLAAERLRNRLSTRRPGLSHQIDELVGRGVEDALDDRWGRSPWVDNYTWAWREPGSTPASRRPWHRRTWARVIR